MAATSNKVISSNSKFEMIKRLDTVLVELRRYRADISRHKWRSDVQERMAVIDCIETLIKAHLYSSMPIDK